MLHIEKTSNLTVLEKGVNKKVLAFTDDPKIFRVLKIKADGKKNAEDFKVLSNQVTK